MSSPLIGGITSVRVSDARSGGKDDGDTGCFDAGANGITQVSSVAIRQQALVVYEKHVCGNGDGGVLFINGSGGIEKLKTLLEHTVLPIIN